MFKNISLKNILLLAFFLRLIAALFSEGYGMHDDHFLIIEAASSWANHYDYNNWLPWSPGSAGHPEGHSFTYVGLNYIFFEVFQFLGFEDPKTLMIINRLIHALFSLTVVYYGYKITRKLADEKAASIVGLILAAMWMMPFLSVRNLVEMTAIPFLMMGMYLIISDKWKYPFFFAGMLIGLSVSFRYQVGVFALGVAGYYFFRFEWKKFISFCAGVLVCFGITQGVVDFFIWGYPFAEFMGYVVYNMHEGTAYMPNHNYFMYFYVLFGVMLVPMGILAFIGFFKAAKDQLLIFIPTMAFILFHTIYPNRQERFVFTVLPFVIIVSIIGILKLAEKAKWEKFWRISWKAFWVLNIPLLLVATVSSSKYSRINAMYSLYNNSKGDELILLEGSGKSPVSMLPKFYAGKWHYEFEETEVMAPTENAGMQDFIFFFGEDNLEERIQYYQEYYPNMELVEKCEPSNIDKLLHTINPKNSNQYIEVWRTKK